MADNNREETVVCPLYFKSAPEDINQHRNNDADDDHRCNGDEDPAASALDTDIARQFAEPVQQPGGELEDQPQDQND